MKCIKCKKSNPEGSKFCASCGAEIASNNKISFRHQELVNKVSEHLEFVGYELGDPDLSKDGKYIRLVARHENRSNLVITFNDSGIMNFISYYRANKEKITKNKLDALNVINNMNFSSPICSYCFSEGNDSLICSSWYPGDYSKKYFADFLDLYEADIKARISSSGILDFT